MNTPNRWLPVIGGVMMNMALGMFYGMSVFMLPLEKEFGWTRAQTSWVTTIGLALIAVWYVIAGFIQDRRGPRAVAVVGGLLFSLGFFLAGLCGVLDRLDDAADVALAVRIQNAQRHDRRRGGDAAMLRTAEAIGVDGPAEGSAGVRREVLQRRGILRPGDDDVWEEVSSDR